MTERQHQALQNLADRPGSPHEGQTALAFRRCPASWITSMDVPGAKNWNKMYSEALEWHYERITRQIVQEARSPA